MKRNLVSSGNGWYLYIPKPILQLLGVEPKTCKVLFTVNNKALNIEVISAQDEEKYAGKMIRRFNKKGAGWGLYIPIPVIELIDVNPENDLVEYIVDGAILKIKKVI